MQEPEGRDLGRIYFPSSPSEFITVFAHFHRAEIARMAGWRDRIDRTTNWAITLVAAMLSVSLSTSNAHHTVLMFAMVLAFFLLMIESRRYRFFDVYRSRVRRLERNYYAKLFDPGVQAEQDWQRIMAADLRAPTFVMSMAEAVSRRLRRNYIWIFLILLGACSGNSSELTGASCSDPPRGPPMMQFADVTHDSGIQFQYSTPDFSSWLPTP